MINNTSIYSISQEVKGDNALLARENLFGPPNTIFKRLGGRLPHKRYLARLRHDDVPSSPCTRQGSRALRLPGLRDQHQQHRWPHQNILNHLASIAAKAATIHVIKMLATEIAKMKLHLRVFAIAPGGFFSEIIAGTAISNKKSTLDAEVLAGCQREQQWEGRDPHGYGEGGDVRGLLPVPERGNSSHQWRIFGGAWNSMNFMKNFGLVPGSAAAVPT